MEQRARLTRRAYPRCQASWILARTKPGQELLATLHLRGSSPSQEHYLPQFYDPEKKRRLPLFATYIFVKVWDLNIGPTARTIGIRSIVHFGEQIAEVPWRVITDLKARENEYGNIVLPKPLTLQKGDKVKLLAGPLAGHTGIYQNMTNQQRIVVLMSLLNATIPVTVDRNLLERAA